MPKYDLTVITSTYGDAFATPDELTANNFLLDADQQKAVFAENLKKYFYDLDNNGEVKIDVRSIPVFTSNNDTSTSIDSSEITGNTLSQLNITQKQKLIANLREGEHIIFILDDITYELIKDVAKFVDLEKIYPDKEYIQKDKFYLKDAKLLAGCDGNNLQKSYICIRDLNDIKDGEKENIKSLHKDIMKMLDDIIKNEK